MGINATGTKNLKLYFEACRNIVFEEVMRTLSYLGEACVRKVRDRSQDESWIDQTGNLRSSIGYAVYETGRAKIVSDFPIVKQGTEGPDEGRKMVEDLASKYAETFALVVVAGMNYAERIESLESKDVLASTELWAYAKINEYLKQTQKRVNQRIAKLKVA